MLDDNQTKLTSSTSPTMYDIFTLKSFNPVYAIQSINNFCHLINQNVA